MIYTRLEPLSDAELHWALRYFESNPGESDEIVAREDRAMLAQSKIDARFHAVASYIFNRLLKGKEATAPSPEDVDYAATIFQQIAPVWWRSMGVRVFR
jgi:hypothetical protein